MSILLLFLSIMKSEERDEHKVVEREKSTTMTTRSPTKDEHATANVAQKTLVGLRVAMLAQGTLEQTKIESENEGHHPL